MKPIKCKECKSPVNKSRTNGGHKMGCSVPKAPKVAKGTLENYPHPKPWGGKDLKGIWDITIKIDGARMLRDKKGKPVARSGKPLYNLENVDKAIGDAEIYKDNWETSMGLVRSSVNGKPVTKDCVYQLWPTPDPRLILGSYENPTAEFLEKLLESQVKLGYEGLMVRQGTRYLKVKPKETADVMITGVQPGTGKHEGRMGALITDHGKVGTGFTDLQREEEWKVGDIIEAEYMEMTKGLKMRHPRYLHRRPDKTEESLPWLDIDDA